MEVFDCDKFYWCDGIDLKGNSFYVNFPIYPKDKISNNFVRQCLFSKKATLFNDMTLVCSYEVDFVTKKLCLCSANIGKRHSELISDIKKLFDIIHSCWGVE